jgi:hypothetical protein
VVYIFTILRWFFFIRKWNWSFLQRNEHTGLEQCKNRHRGQNRHNNDCAKLNSTKSKEETAAYLCVMDFLQPTKQTLYARYRPWNWHRRSIFPNKCKSRDHAFRSCSINNIFSLADTLLETQDTPIWVVHSASLYTAHITTPALYKHSLRANLRRNGPFRMWMFHTRGVNCPIIEGCQSHNRTENDTIFEAKELLQKLLITRFQASAHPPPLL